MAKTAKCMEQIPLENKFNPYSPLNSGLFCYYHTALHYVLKELCPKLSQV